MPFGSRCVLFGFGLQLKSGKLGTNFFQKAQVGYLAPEKSNDLVTRSNVKAINATAAHHSKSHMLSARPTEAALGKAKATGNRLN